MTLKPTQDLETSILRALAGTDGASIKTANELISYKVTKSDTHILPTLGVALSHENQDIRMASAFAIARFGSVAEPYVPKIAEVLSTESKWWVQGALIQALGSIPCQESVRALVSYLTRTEDLRSTFMDTSQAIINLSPLNSKELEVALIRLTKSDAGDIKDWATETYAALRRVRSVVETLEQRTDLSQPHMIIGEYGHTAADVKDQFASQRIDLPNHNGVVFDDYIMYRMNSREEQLSRCRLTIHRISDLHCVVGFIADGNSFNASLDTMIESLATATKWRFDLDPRTTIWVREWHPNLDGESGAKVVDMRWVESRGLFTDPRWSKKNFKDLNEIIGRAN